MSVLSNLEIAQYLCSGMLVKDGDPQCIGAACYELSVGKTYFDLTENNLRVDLLEGESIIIKPWHRVVILTREELEIPNNILARVISKGSFFSVGLSAVCTQADPGFKGRLGIVTQNFSDKYIKIDQGKAIAKMDFTLLSSDTTKPYDGQHGFQSNIWPIDTTLQKVHADVAGDSRVDTELNEAYRVLPKDVSQVIVYLMGRQRSFSMALFGLLIINTLVLAFSLYPTKPLDAVTAIVINLVSQSLTAAYVFFWNKK